MHNTLLSSYMFPSSRGGALGTSLVLIFPQLHQNEQRSCVPTVYVTVQTKTSLVCSGISRNTTLKYSVTKMQPKLCIVPMC